MSKQNNERKSGKVWKGLIILAALFAVSVAVWRVVTKKRGPGKKPASVASKPVPEERQNTQETASAAVPVAGGAASPQNGV